MINDAEAQIRSELDYGERLIWCGRPRPYPRLTKDAVLLHGFLAIVFAIAAIAALNTLAQQGQPGRLVALVSMLLVSGGMFVYLLVALPKRGRETAYGLTDQRAIIVHDLAHKHVERLRFPQGSTVVL